MFNHRISTFQPSSIVQRALHSFVIFCVCIFSFQCSSVKKLAIERDLTRIINQSDIFQSELIGLSIYDTYNERFIININEDKYLTPASNTKSFTLFASAGYLQDSIPTFAYSVRNDSLIIRPLGDPTFLHSDFEGQNAFSSLKALSQGTVYLSYPETSLPAYGPGWAWDDFSYEFQAERSQFPIYGNVVNATITNGEPEIVPSFFEDFVDFNDTQPTGRVRAENIFNINASPKEGDTLSWKIPFRTSRELNHQLLADTLGKTVKQIDTNYYLEDTIYNGRALPLYATMMLRSDNFLAEQMLYMGAAGNGHPSIAKYVEELGERRLVFLPDPLIWVDGSGLSRYNMVTPRNQVALLSRFLKTMDWGTIQLIFPNGGVSGTIKNWYAGEQPYVFAKTGTLRHNHCLSGFLKTRSGKLLIFSFMNNHFTRPVTEVKLEMQQILEKIRDAY